MLPPHESVYHICLHCVLEVLFFPTLKEKQSLLTLNTNGTFCQETSLQMLL
jgi:hypothetical protein